MIQHGIINRLIQMTRSGVVTTYGYDGWGNLVQETASGVTTEFVLDENAAYTRILGEVRSDGGERLYAYGPEGFTAQLAVGGAVEYPLLDGLGSVRQLTDASGTVILTRSYDAYGAVRFVTGTGGSRLGYTGELQDLASGLVYLRARHYSPVLGRFLQRDSFGGFGQRPQSLNRYVYVQNNPLRHIDPSGHDPCLGCFIVPPGVMLEDWGFNAMLPYFGLPVALGTVGKIVDAREPSLDLTAEWYFEMGEGFRVYGVDFKITQALMHDEGVEEARQKYIANGRQDLLESDGSWHDYKFGLPAALRELFGDVVWGGFDWSTSFLGGYQVEIINVIKTYVTPLTLCSLGSIVDIRVHNRTGWASATRVQGHSFKQDEKRSQVGPGGNLDQIYTWRERIP